MKIMSNKILLGFILIISFLWSDTTEEQLRSIQKNQIEIMKRLETLEKNQSYLNRELSQLNPNNKTKPKETAKKASDNTVYDIAEDGSLYFGPKNAKVVITEWTDFQ